jgi:hypothetical protein
MEVFLEKGSGTVPLQGCWFDSGFQGAMGELLCAIEDDRPPYHSAKNNLKTLNFVLLPGKVQIKALRLTLDKRS